MSMCLYMCKIFVFVFCMRGQMSMYVCEYECVCICDTVHPAISRSGVSLVQMIESEWFVHLLLSTLSGHGPPYIYIHKYVLIQVRNKNKYSQKQIFKYIHKYPHKHVHL